MTNCPTDAIHRHANGEVYITDSCIGCEQCAQACPYHVIQMAYVEKPSAMDKMFSLPRKALGVLFGLGGRNHGDHHDPKAKKKATKCDLCGSEKLRHDLGGRAACELSCPTGAIIRVDPADYLQHVMPKTDVPGIDG
jgi:Fe-S-cluster-containing hydrogenase component 2